MFARYFISALIIISSALTFPSSPFADTILDDFQVNVEPHGHPPQNSPYSVADWNTETIYTTWLSFRDSVNWDVALQLFDYDLQIIGEVQYLNLREGTYDCQQPRLAISTNGVGAAWIEEREPNRMLFRSLDAMGNPISPPVQLEDNYEDFARDSLNIASLSDGYILVWYDPRDTSVIWAQIVDFDGNLIGDNFPIRPDSTGGILGLECQNHPDGRVLVSWVADNQYSRGRWLDAEGIFMGDVFDMADPWIDDEIANSIVRFESGGNGLIYQYSNLIVGEPWGWDKYIYFTYMDLTGVQANPRIEMGAWASHWDEGSSYFDMGISFPDLIYLPNDNYLTIRHYYGSGYFMGGFWVWNSYNRLFSSLYGDYIVPWGVINNENGYDLCRLNEVTFLYSFDLEDIGLRQYEISTLDSSQQIIWVGEPGFGTPQNDPDICVHQDGSFRLIYNNWFGVKPQLYTRHFDALGVPSSPDTLVSMNEDLIPLMTSAGKIEKTVDDQALAVWPLDGDVLGTTYNGNSWSSQVNNFGCVPVLSWDCLPKLDINNNNHLILIWKSYYELEPGYYYWQLYCQPFSQLFTALYPSFLVGPTFWVDPKFDVSLRDDGRFLICWVYGEIRIQAGIDYHELVGDPINLGYCPSSSPALHKSNFGYWLTWIGGNTLSLQLIDTDGNPVGDQQVISEEEASPTGDPDLAVSETGNFAVVWQDARDDEGDIYCRQFYPDGSFFGDEFKVNSDPPGTLQGEPAVAFGPNDQLYFTWTDHRNAGGQGDIYCKVIAWEDSLVPPDPPDPPPVPYVFALKPPAPNPFNTGTKISYSIPESGQVSLTVHNLLGREVASLANGQRVAGDHQVTFDGSGLASGVFILRLESGNQITHRKLVLLK